MKDHTKTMSVMPRRALILVALWTYSMACCFPGTHAQNTCDVPCQITDNNQSFTCENSGCTELPLASIPATTRRIHLKNNSITTLPLLTNLTQLDTLDLSDNKINSLANVPFKYCANLSHLYLTNNNLTVIRSDHIEGLTALLSIHLEGNQLVDIETNLFYHHSSKLQVIDLSSNQINKLHYNSFTDLKQLDTLLLSYNKIENISLHLDGTAVNVLMLDNNLIKTLGNQFLLGRTLKILDLGSNLISDIEPKAFRDLDAVKFLNLSYNSLTSIDSKIFDFRTLEQMYLDYNPLEELNSNCVPVTVGTFSCQHMPKLKVVRDGAFTNAIKLHTVYLNENPKLQSIEPGAFRGKNSTLQGLDFSASGLQTLSEDLLDWSDLSSLNLGGNYWNCDCNLLWMKNAAFPGDARSEIKCYSPFYLRGRGIDSVSSERFHCGIWRDPRVGVALTIIITVLFVTIATMLAYRFRRKVFPCYYKKTNYATLYNSDDTEDEAVTINWKQHEKTGLTEAALPTATQV